MGRRINQRIKQKRVKMKTNLVRDLQDEKYTLVQDSQDVRAVLDSIGYSKRRRNSIGCLLVEVDDGDYGEVWAIDRSVPLLTETAYQIN
jgi:hypothetical protein